jgi:hypothetical protein
MAYDVIFIKAFVSFYITYVAPFRNVLRHFNDVKLTLQEHFRDALTSFCRRYMESFFVILLRHFVD